MENSTSSNLSGRREFSSGSRKTPDKCDQFLEELGYYRKHTPTDSTCLFRVVSEQVNGIQLYHENVRKYCVEYLRKNSHLFANDIDWDFECYLTNISQTHTYGSLLELKALAMFFNANVEIFEPFTNGRWFMRSETARATWRLFHGRNNHFDSVFTIEYMREAALCQAVVYEVLYERVFRLPDDRQLVLSQCKETNCVLANTRFCHFHNVDSFPRIQRLFGVHVNKADYRMNGVGNSDKNFGNGRKRDLLLYDPDVSCVRQLLNAGITPFPYKAAKSLDPNIYRNVEFHSWMEIIKMNRMAKKNQETFQVGMKCVDRIDGAFKICRIEQILLDNLTCLVRLNNVPGSIVVRMEVLKPYHSLKMIDGVNIRTRLQEQCQWIPWHANAPMPMVMLMLNLLPAAMMDLQINPQPSFLDGVPSNISAQHPIFYLVSAGYPAMSPLPVLSDPAQLTAQPFANIQPLDAAVGQHLQQQQEPPQVQQLQQSQDRQQQLLFNHHNTYPVQNYVYASTVPVDATQQYWIKSSVGYGPIPHTGPAHFMLGGGATQPTGADSNNSAAVVPEDMDIVNH